MATTLTKLFPTGVLQSRVELNEITYTSIKVGPTGVYAALFDEISLSTSTAERKTSTGTYLVSGYFDEVTIAPQPPITYNITNGSQVFTDQFGGSIPVARLGGKYTDGNTFNIAVWNDLVPLGSRVIVKWNNVANEVDMGIVTLVEKAPYPNDSNYVYVTNPTNFILPVVNGYFPTDARATYFRIEFP